MSLTQLGVGQILGQGIPAVIMMNYYQDIKQMGSQGIIRAKFKYLKPFNKGTFRKLLLTMLPKLSQFGSQPLICFACNIVVTLTYTETSDIWVARVGLLMYYLGFNLFGCVMLAYVSGSEQQLSLNLLTKKYIRSKAFMMKQFIWAIIIQAILVIVGFVLGT